MNVDILKSNDIKQACNIYKDKYKKQPNILLVSVKTYIKNKDIINSNERVLDIVVDENIKDNHLYIFNAANKEDKIIINIKE